MERSFNNLKKIPYHPQGLPIKSSLNMSRNARLKPRFSSLKKNFARLIKNSLKKKSKPASRELVSTFKNALRRLPP